MIKVTLEFHTAAEAIVALNAIMNLPEVKVSGSEVIAAAEKVRKERKGRADKGKSREPYKPRVIEPAAPVATAPVEADKAQPAGVVLSTPAAAAPSPAEVVSKEIQAQQAAHAPTLGEKDAEAQAAMEKLYNAKGTDACRVLLGQFGVSRIREIPTARRTDFLQAAAEAAI